jgi:exonuclease RecJ (EC 3.1.-.-)
MIEPRWRLIEADESVTEQLHRALGIHPVLCRILAQRGICTVEDARRFFRPSLQELPSPFALQDIERAVARLEQAVDRSERILLYGDYDVDGTTGVALLYTFFSRFHSNIDYYLPHREQEGYGISSAGVEYARRSGSTLIVAVDCGTHDHEAISLAKSYGIDVIVCDHHPPEGHLPAACAILNPRRADCSYPHPHLSGCGIAFKLAQGLALAQEYTGRRAGGLAGLCRAKHVLRFGAFGRRESRADLLWPISYGAPTAHRNMGFIAAKPMYGAAKRARHGVRRRADAQCCRPAEPCLRGGAPVAGRRA